MIAKKKIENEKFSTIQLFKSIENSAQVNNKLKIDLDIIVKESDNLKIELENERKKYSSIENIIHILKMALENEKKNEDFNARIIHNLQKELGNEKKKKESNANIIHNLKNKLENMKKKRRKLQRKSLI